MPKRRILFSVFIILTLGLSVSIEAQARRKAAPPLAVRQKRKPMKKEAAPATPQTVTANAYLPGETRISVRGEEHPVIRIGMAASGITVVEFPASDRFFAVHPPENGDWVEVEKSPSLKTDHHLVLRAGKDLMSASGPAASISVQMRSGLILTFWVYPVKAITQQTHRCVISYDRAEVVAARKKAGLAVDLGESETSEMQTPAKIANTVAAAESKPAPESVNAPVKPAEPEPVVAGLGASAYKNLSEKEEAMVKKALVQAIAEPKQFKKWTPALHGLSLSVSAYTREMKNGTARIALVAVRNTQNEAIRLVPDHPDLFVETLDEKGKPLQIAPIRKLHSESTTTGSVVPAGATVWYAVTYAAPVLGTKQRLRLAVAQTNAADEPAAVNLIAGVNQE